MATVGDFWWDQSHQAIVFEIIQGPSRQLFQIAVATLNDHFRTEASKEAALACFEEHKQALGIRAGAERERLEKNAAGRFVIPRPEFERWGL